MVAIKCSFLWSLQKLHSPRPWVRRSLWAIQIINGVYGIVQFFVSIFFCVPVRKFWYPHVPGHCINNINFLIGTITIVLATVSLRFLDYYVDTYARLTGCDGPYHAHVDHLRYPNSPDTQDHGDLVPLARPRRYSYWNSPPDLPDRRGEGDTNKELDWQFL